MGCLLGNEYIHSGAELVWAFWAGVATGVAPLVLLVASRLGGGGNWRHGPGGRGEA